MRLVDPDSRTYTDYVDKDGVRQVKTNDATPDRIERVEPLPQVEIIWSFNTVAVGISGSIEAQAGGSEKNPVQGYTVGKGSTTQIQGAKGSDKKKQERVDYKEQ